MKIRILKGQKLKDNSKRIADFYKESAGKVHYNEAVISESNLIGVIEDDFGRIIGAARAFTDFCEYAFIVDMYISEKFRFKGYGTSLLSSLCSSCRKTGLKRIYLINTSPDSSIENFLKRSNFSHKENIIYTREFY